MALRSLADMLYTTQSQLIAGYYNQLTQIDELTAGLIANAGVTDRPSITYNRKVANPTAAYFDCSTSFTFGAMSGSNVAVNLLNISVPFAVCTIGQNLYSSFIDQIQTETVAAIDGIGLKIAAEAAGSGNGSSAIFGIASAITTAQTISAGSSFTTDDLDYLIDTVKVKTPGRTAFVGNPATVRAVVSKLKTETSALAYDVLAGTQLRTPMYGGYNILKNENIAADNSLYLVDLDQGYKLIFGTSDSAKIGGVFSLDDLGKSQTGPNHLFHLYAHVAGVSFNQKAIGKLQGVV